jgi:polyisoprenoid-binding protein YceI
MVHRTNALCQPAEPRMSPRMKMPRLAVLLLAALLAACGHLLPSQHQTVEPTELRAGAYRLDPNHAILLWKVDHLGFSTFVGRFDRLDATLDFDPERPAESALEVVVETASVSTHVPGFADDLRGSSWLDVERYPEARFISTEIALTGPTTGTVTGELTLLDVTQPVTLDVTFNGGADSLLTGTYTLGFEATTVIDRTAFGLSTFAPAIGSEVALEIHAEFGGVDE